MYQLFILAAVFYVNNTDLIHVTELVTASQTELIIHSQTSTNAWGGFAIATGAALKPEKCFAKLMIYRFVRGRASTSTLAQLPSPTHS